MKSIGIICECNPFHSGHGYLIEQARASGADCVVCVMSGYFTQRGEAAIADPYFRSRALLYGGADLVLELPYPYSSSSAEFFAGAGVDILSRLSVDELWFGSECGDLTLLQRGADASLDEVFLNRYGQSTATADGTARAYFDALQAHMGEDVSLASNDILGIAYLSALKKYRSKMKPVTIKRQGSAYLDGELQPDRHPSATAIRRRMLADGIEAVSAYLSSDSMDILTEADRVGGAMASLMHAERAILMHLRMQTPEEIQKIAELEGGLGNRLLHAAQESCSLEQLLTLAATKKYTTSRIQRGILYSMTGVEREDLKRSPSYVRVLAANRTGCAFLAANRRHASIRVVTKQSELPTDENARRQETLHCRAVGVYTLCLPKIMDATALLRKNCLILK